MVVRAIKLAPGAELPRFAHWGDGGADLVSIEEVHLAPGGGRATVRTGIALEIPQGWAGLVLPRSGLAAHHGVTCLNAPGLIDSGYRGELMVVLVNTDPTSPYVVQRGDRVAQLLLTRVEAVRFLWAEELSPSLRRGGFGHTGR